MILTNINRYFILGERLIEKLDNASEADKRLVLNELLKFANREGLEFVGLEELDLMDKILYTIGSIGLKLDLTKPIE